jgi:rhamnosyltransferase
VPPCEAMDGQGISVIVRARDEAASLGLCLELVRAQRPHGGSVELILVDNASSDGTVAVARGYGARILSVPAGAFTFGGSLNLGAANARGELLVALSAHAFARDPEWLSRLAAAFGDPKVACAAGDRYDLAGRPLAEPIIQDIALARAHPFGPGYSNAAGGFRAALWRQRPFRADLPSSEDREWAWYWMERGYRCVVDPTLVVEHDHTHDPVLQIYRRARLEAEGMAMFLDGWLQEPAPLLREWWSDTRFYDSRLRARLSHRRAARILGMRAGLRRAGLAASDRTAPAAPAGGTG